MAKYTNPTPSTILVDFEDAAVANISLDVAALTDAVKHAAMMFGFQTVMRNATAGKMDELPKAHAAMLQRVQTWQSGKWVTEAQAKAAAGLSDDERNKIIGEVLIMAKKAKGDTRTGDEILAAFNAIPAEKQQAALESLKKVIDKRVKDALRQKKALAKAVGGAGAVEY